MAGLNINEGVDSLGNIKDKTHTIQHTMASTADHVFPAGTVNFLRADGTWAAPPSGSGTPSGTVLNEITFGITASAGISSEYSRGDHTHGSPTDPGTAHAGSTNTHGVAGTIAAKADITDTVLVIGANTVGNVGGSHGFTPASPSNTAQFLRGDATPTWATPASGSDPWTYVTLAAAFTTTSATAQSVTGLVITPSANTKYDIFGMFYVRTASSAISARIGQSWPSGLTLGVATYYMSQSATTQVLVNLNAVAGSGITAVGAMASTATWPAQMNALIQAGASPSGSIQVQFCSESNGTEVTMQAGSFLKYRSYT